MATTNTGSIVIGAVPGMAYGNLPSGTKALGVRLIYVYANPDTYVTCVTGSDIAYSIGDGKVYIGDVANGPGGSTWTEIK